MPEPITEPRRPRPAARILLTDAADRILLFRFTPAGLPAFWCTPGGAVDPGESYDAAARRELLEETGIVADPGPQVARKLADFTTLEGVPVTADERYYHVRIVADGDAPGVIDTGGHTPLEQAVMREWRWFDTAALAALDEPFFPEDIAALVAPLLPLR